MSPDSTRIPEPALALIVGGYAAPDADRLAADTAGRPPGTVRWMRFARQARAGRGLAVRLGLAGKTASSVTRLFA